MKLDKSKFNSTNEAAGTVSDEAVSDDNPLKAAKQKSVDEINAQRSGIGPRLKVGATRGKGSQIISYEVFDESKPDTIPTSVEQFLSTLSASQNGKAVAEAEMLSYLIDGFNAQSYQNASDPIAEHIDASWPEAIQKSFRSTVRGFMQAANVSVEDAVAFLKPSIVKSLSKS